MRKLVVITTLAAAVFAGPAAAATKNTSLHDDFFAKGKLTVKKGTTVVWKWHTSDTHTVTEINGKFSSKQTKKGDFKHRFTKRGKVTVYCLIHPTVMRQTIVVK